MHTPPILLPEIDSFSDLLEYVSEWDHETMSHRDGVLPNESPRLVDERYKPREIGCNNVGPFCTVDLSQLGGIRSRSIAVRATDAVIEAVAPRIVTPGIVTPDDDLSFKIIGHKHDGRALVILQHGYISGSHWLAEIDPATIPTYPFAVRDETVGALTDRIKTATKWVPWRRNYAGHAFDYGYDGWYPDGDESKRLQRPLRPVVVAHVDAAGEITFKPEGLAHLEALEQNACRS